MVFVSREMGRIVLKKLGSLTYAQNVSSLGQA